MANFSVPIRPWSTISGNQWRQNRIIEENGQTYKEGVPVQLAADGGVEIWNASTYTAGIAGVSYEPFSNLGTTGGATTPYVQPFQPFSGPGSAITFGSVQNESSAVNIPHGAPLNDGRIGITLNDTDTVWTAAFGNNGTATKPAFTNVGVQYGLTSDTNGFWYVDANKTSSNVVLTVVGLDPRYTPAAGTNVLFVFLAASQQIMA